MSSASHRLVLSSRRASRHLGSRIAAVLEPGDLVVLDGALGTGKTFLARAILSAAGAKARVVSPTFVIVQEYETPRGDFVHADLYRLLDGTRRLDVEVERLGLSERRREGAVLLVEWGAQAVATLGGEPNLMIALSIEGDSVRNATLSGPRSDGID